MTQPRARSFCNFGCVAQRLMWSVTVCTTKGTACTSTGFVCCCGVVGALAAKLRAVVCRVLLYWALGGAAQLAGAVCILCIACKASLPGGCRYSCCQGALMHGDVMVVQQLPYMHMLARHAWVTCSVAGCVAACAAHLILAALQ